MEWIVDEYYKDNAKKLRTMVDKILFKLKFHDVDNEDFYSLANEIFVKALNTYDSSQDFDGFIYSCLVNKFKTEMTRRTRDKRCVKVIVEEENNDGAVIYTEKVIKDDSLDREISSSKHKKDISENYTLGDLVADKKTVEGEVFEEENKEEWRREVKEYLKKLSPLQRKIAFLMSDNNTPDEICEELHITMKHFENSLKRILADERIKILRPLVERN